MRKTWSNGYVSVSIEVKPLVNTAQEVGFVSPELFGMLDETEKKGLQENYAYYEKMAASLSKAQSDQFNPGSTISFHDINRNYDNRDNAARRVEEVVRTLQAKYGMGAMEQEPVETTKGVR